MARPIAATTFQNDALDERKLGFPYEDFEDGDFEVPDVTSGMVSGVSRDKLPRGSASSIVNGRVRDNWVGRRGGYTDFITKPDSNTVLKIVGFNGEENANWVVRVAVGSIYATRTTASWTQFTGTAYAETNRISAAQMLGSLYLANSEKKIVAVDLASLTFAEVSEAPTCRYITPFADRLVAAYIYDPSSGTLPFGLAWSENADPTDWDGAGAGSENLIQNPSDTGDEITGILGYGNTLIILRERSIWHGTRQPFQTAPISFVPVITDQGCDMPYTAVRTLNENGKLTGIMFADYKTNGVYSYTPGNRPQRVSRAIEDKLFTGITNPSMAEATWDVRYQEYHLGFPTDSDNPEQMTDYRIFSQQSGAWTTDDSPTATAIGGMSGLGQPTMIDDLIGNIDDLTGNIDDLSVIPLQAPILLKCGTDGSVNQESMATAGSHTFTWESQDLGSVSRRRHIKFLQAAISAAASGNVILAYSKDGSSWTTIKTIADVSALTKIGFKRGISGDKLFWRVTAVAKQFRMTEWWTRLSERGFKRLG